MFRLALGDIFDWEHNAAYLKAPGFTVARRAGFIQLDKEHQRHRRNECPIRTTAARQKETRLVQPTETESRRPARVALELIVKAKARATVRVIVVLRLPPHEEDSAESQEPAIRLVEYARLDEFAQVNVAGY